MHANFCRRNGTALPSLQTRFDYHTLVMFYKIHTKQAPSYLTSLLPPLSSRSGYTFRKLSYRFPTVSRTSTLNSFLPRAVALWNALPWLMFNKQAQSILLRSFSNPILKYKPSPILLCFSFSFFFSWLFFFFLFLFPFSSFSACYVPYFSSTGTQPDKYWFTFSAILFKYMSLKSEVWSLKDMVKHCLWHSDPTLRRVDQSAR